MDYTLDKPITDAKDDLLNRADFAKNIADAIVSFSGTDESVVFGLQGDWGSGKTSIAGMIEKYLKAKNIRPVRFETWLTTDRESLFKEFFTCILDAINRDGKLHVCYEDILNYANQYGRKILRSFSVNIGFFTTGMDKLIDEPESRSLESRKHDINEKLKNADVAPIVVFIDDIDRLSYDEIAVLFQLVKNIADFKNIIYVLCYDKNIVGNALEKIHPGKGYQYIEKVIQIPIDIPMPGAMCIYKYFTELLNKLIDGNNKEALQFDKTHWDDIFYRGIAKFLKNIRDCNRLYNSFALKYRLFGKECDFADLLAITFLENVAPAIVKIIRLNKGFLLGSDSGFHVDVKPDDANRVWDDINDASNLENNEAFKCIIGHLFPAFAKVAGFPHSGFLSSGDKHTNKISNPEYFDRYFCLTLDEGEVSRTEVNTWLNCEKQEDLTNWINIWRSNEKLENALNEANKLIGSVDGASYNVCKKDGFVNLLRAFSSQKFRGTASRFFGLGEAAVRNIIIYNILNLLLKTSYPKQETIQCLFKDSLISIFLKFKLLEYLSSGYDWWFGSEVLKKADRLLNEEEFTLAQSMFMECIYNEKEKEDFLYNDACGLIVGIWKYMDKEDFKKYVMMHQRDKDLSKFAIVCVDEGMVYSSAEESYKQWYFRSSGWIEELDFESTVEAVKRVLNDRTCAVFDNEKKIKLCAFLKFAEMKKKNEVEGKMDFNLSLRLKEFRDVCEEYRVPILG